MPNPFGKDMQVDALEQILRSASLRHAGPRRGKPPKKRVPKGPNLAAGAKRHVGSIVVNTGHTREGLG